MSHRTAVALVSVSSVLWATLGTAAALVPEVPPTTIGASTLGLGGLLLLVMFPRRARAMLRGPSRRWVLIGAGAVVVYAFAFYTSMRVAGVAVGTVLNIGSAPVFTALLEFVIDRRRPGRAWCLGSAVGIAGLVSLTFSVHRPGVGGLPAAGIGLALVAGFLYALYAYCSGRVIAQRGDPAGAMAAIFGAAGIVLTPVIVAIGGPLLQSHRTVLTAAYLSVVCVFVAYWLFGIALRTVPASTATTVTLLEPVLASVLASRVLGEVITPVGWLGVGLVVGGVGIASRPGATAGTSGEAQADNGSSEDASPSPSPARDCWSPEASDRPPTGRPSRSSP